MFDFFHRTSLLVLFLSCLAFSIQLFAQQVRETEKPSGSAASAQKASSADSVDQRMAGSEPAQAPVRIHMVPWGTPATEVKTQNKPIGLQSNNGPVLQYWGGPVISNVQVVVVLWGNFVDSGSTSGLHQFFGDITQSSWFDLLTEYSSVGLTGFGGAGGTNQIIGHGTVASSAAVTITPSVCPGGSTNPACTITDNQIQTEIVAQINAGHLPVPTTDPGSGSFNTIYMTYFPPGVTINLDPSTKSCQRGGFCAYHSNVLSGSFQVPYGVHPDFSQGGCAPFQGCGNGSAFQNLTGASSHELAEAVTDVDVGSATTFAPPLGWLDQNSGNENGDFCNQIDAQVTVNSNTYTVQRIASNMQTNAQSPIVAGTQVSCVAGPAHFQTQAPSNVAPGSQFQVTITAQSSLDNSALTAYVDKVHFTSSDGSATLPADYTFVAADNGSHTFNITLNTKGTETVTATDTLMAPINATVSLNVQDNPDMTVVSTHSGNFTQGQTGATYTLTASNIGDLATTGTVTLTDNLPAGLSATAISGTGWTCTLTPLTCTRADALAGHSAYPAVTLTVNVAGNAPTGVVNSVNVSGGGEVNFFNNTSSDPTTINQLVDLTISKSHSGKFSQGQTGATYTIIVGNTGTQSSSGTVTVVDNLPTSLTATAMTGSGWNCTITGQPTCTRNDGVASNGQFPPITLTVNVAANAPGTVTNSATVSGGGDTNTGNDTANDVTTIVAAVSMSLSSTGTQTVSAGGSAVYTFNVNSGGGTVTFGCTGLPQVSSCLFNPPSVAGTGSVNVTITTTKGGSVMPPGDGGGPRQVWPMAWLLTILAMLATAELMRRSTRHTLRRPAMGLAGMLAIMMLASCGGSHTPPPQPGTPPGTYQVTVTATNVTSNSQASAQVTLVVQ